MLLYLGKVTIYGCYFARPCDGFNLLKMLGTNWCRVIRINFRIIRLTV